MHIGRLVVNTMIDKNDFDDPAMKELLSRWGETIHGEADGTNESEDATPSSEARKVFDPPHDLTRMNEQLDAVDEEIKHRRSSAVLELARSRWFRGGLAMAASLTLVVCGWLFTQDRAWLLGTAPSAGLGLRHIQLSTEPQLMRGGGSTRFQSGDVIFIHCSAESEGIAFVAMLDSNLTFGAGAGAKAMPIREGPNTLPFSLSLDEQTGTESVVILSSGEAMDTDAFRELIAAAAAAAAGATTHQHKLDAIVKALREDGLVDVDTETFKHLPR